MLLAWAAALDQEKVGEKVGTASTYGDIVAVRGQVPDPPPPPDGHLVPCGTLLAEGFGCMSDGRKAIPSARPEEDAAVKIKIDKTKPVSPEAGNGIRR